MRVGQHIFCFALCVPADIYAGTLLAIQLTYIFLRFMRSTRYILFVAVSIPADIYYTRCKHTGSIGKQLIMSSLPDWHWRRAQLVSRSHYYVIMLSDVGTRMGLIGKQNLLQLRHYMCYVITKISPASSRTSPTHAARRLPPRPPM